MCSESAEALSSPSFILKILEDLGKLYEQCLKRPCSVFILICQKQVNMEAPAMFITGFWSLNFGLIKD